MLSEPGSSDFISIPDLPCTFSLHSVFFHRDFGPPVFYGWVKGWNALAKVPYTPLELAQEMGNCWNPLSWEREDLEGPVQT